MLCSWEGNWKPGGKQWQLTTGGWLIVTCGLTACTPGSVIVSPPSMPLACQMALRCPDVFLATNYLRIYWTILYQIFTYGWSWTILPSFHDRLRDIVIVTNFWQKFAYPDELWSSNPCVLQAYFLRFALGGLHVWLITCSYCCMVWVDTGWRGTLVSLHCCQPVTECWSFILYESLPHINMW